MTAVVKKIVLARQQAAAGVDYSPRRGASCPWCGHRCEITSTRPWEDNTRIRYHRCKNTSCPVSALNVNIKSIEVDTCPVTTTLKTERPSARR